MKASLGTRLTIFHLLLWSRVPAVCHYVLGFFCVPLLFLYLLRARIPLLSFEGATEFVTNLFPFELYTTLFEVCWTVDTDVQLK